MHRKTYPQPGVSSRAYRRSPVKVREGTLLTEASGERMKVSHRLRTVGHRYESPAGFEKLSVTMITRGDTRHTENLTLQNTTFGLFTRTFSGHRGGWLQKGRLRIFSRGNINRHRFFFSAFFSSRGYLLNLGAERIGKLDSNPLSGAIESVPYV